MGEEKKTDLVNVRSKTVRIASYTREGAPVGSREAAAREIPPARHRAGGDPTCHSPPLLPHHTPLLPVPTTKSLPHLLVGRGYLRGGRRQAPCSQTAPPCQPAGPDSGPTRTYQDFPAWRRLADGVWAGLAWPQERMRGFLPYLPRSPPVCLCLAPQSCVGLQG